MYLYQTTIYTDTSNVFGIDVSANASAKTDFETNYKSSVLPITVLQLAETTIEINKTYTQFKALIVSPILWSDVKMVQDDDSYILYLLSENPL